MPSKTAKKRGPRFREVSSKTNWKNIQSKNKIKRKTKLGVIVLGLLLLLLLLSQVVKFTKTLFSPWQISNSVKNYTWDGKFNINFLLRSKTISLVSYNPSDQKVEVIDIPDNTYIEAAHGYGKWQVRSIYDLGQSQSGLGGNRLLKDSLQDLFAQPIDGFLDFSGVYPNLSGKEIIEKFRSDFFGPFNILHGLKTDLTLWELIKLKFGLASVRFDNVILIDLQEINVLSVDYLLDGSEVLIADPAQLDLALVDLADPKIKSERKTIALFNASEKPLFAQKWARLISNMGGDVIITANSQNTLDKSLVTGERSDTLLRLQQIFNSSCSSSECDKIQKEDEDLSSSRSQINLKLGLDLN